MRRAIPHSTTRYAGLVLALSAKTIETYRMRVMRKLNLSHRSDLVRYALRSGLLQRDAVE